MGNRTINLKSLAIVISILFSCNNSESEAVESMETNETEELSLSQSNNEDEQARSTLYNFYTEYLSQIAKFPVDEKKLKGIKSSYCSDRLLQILDTMELDYDPFTNSQDFDSNTANQLTIAKKSNLSYTVSFASNNEYTTTLFVIKEKDKYYIDSILDLY